MSDSLEDTLLTEALSSIAVVTFTKRDNTTRVMRCTTNLNLVPSDKHPTKQNANYNPDVYRVFDLDISEWRSFRKSTILKIESGVNNNGETSNNG